MLKPSPEPAPVIGLLYPGEMGTALAELLLSQGCRVVTTLAGRSLRTQQFCEQAGLEVRDSLLEVVAEADVILSVVTPGAALEVAEQVFSTGIPRPCTYIDANSISPMSMAKIERVFAGTAVDVVDVTIHGLASRLRQQGTLFASGARAEIVEALFGQTVRIKRLGSRPGQASLYKMLLGSMSKGIIALFLQTGLVARNAGLLGEFLTDLHRYYPDVLAFVERSLPTYPQHARRRSEEMRELEATLAHFQFHPGLAEEIQRIFLSLAESGFSRRCAAHGEAPTVPQLLDWIAMENTLRTEQPDTQTEPVKHL